MAIAWTRRKSTWHDPVWGWITLPPGLRTRRVGLEALTRRDQAIFRNILKRERGLVLVWLINGLRAVPQKILLEARNMVDATNLEKAAMTAALRPLGEYVGSIGMTRPLADYRREEVLTLIEVVITAYQEHMANANPNDIPF